MAKIEETGCKPFSQNSFSSDTLHPDQRVLSWLTVGDKVVPGMMRIKGTPDSNFYDKKALAFPGSRLLFTETIPSAVEIVMGPRPTGEAIQALQKRIEGAGEKAYQVKATVELYMPSFSFNKDRLAVVIQGRDIFTLDGDIRGKGYAFSGRDLVYSADLDSEREPDLFPFRLIDNGDGATFEYLAFPPYIPNGEILPVSAGFTMKGYTHEALYAQVQDTIAGGKTDIQDIQNIINPFMKVSYAAKTQRA